ncbi:excisionase family DNA-binding protein [Flavobacterium sp.]|uniref:excisionase family DNA-binding protein n=1 Tax=Flavobacterium sp. TaxID=239 RepID=UPI00391B3F5F
MKKVTNNKAMVSGNKVEKYLSRHEAASFLRVSAKTIDRLIRDNRIKAFRLGRRVLVYSETLTEEYLLSIKPKFKNK